MCFLMQLSRGDCQKYFAWHLRYKLSITMFRQKARETTVHHLQWGKLNLCSTNRQVVVRVLNSTPLRMPLSTVSEDSRIEKKNYFIFGSVRQYYCKFLSLCVCLAYLCLPYVPVRMLSISISSLHVCSV